MIDAPAGPAIDRARIVAADHDMVSDFLRTSGCTFVLGTGRTASNPDARHTALVDSRGRILGVGSLLRPGDSEAEFAVAILADRCTHEALCALVGATTHADPAAARVYTSFAWDEVPSPATIAGAGLSMCAQVAFDGFTDVVFDVQRTASDRTRQAGAA